MGWHKSQSDVFLDGNFVANMPYYGTVSYTVYLSNSFFINTRITTVSITMSLQDWILENTQRRDSI